MVEILYRRTARTAMALVERLTNPDIEEKLFIVIASPCSSGLAFDAKEGRACEDYTVGFLTYLPIRSESLKR
jgi:hypothetical protein